MNHVLICKAIIGIQRLLSLDVPLNLDIYQDQKWLLLFKRMTWKVTFWAGFTYPHLELIYI